MFQSLTGRLKTELEYILESIFPRFNPSQVG